MKPLFSENLHIRVPVGFNEAVASAAAEEASTTADFIRGLTIAELRRRGIKPFAAFQEARAV